MSYEKHTWETGEVITADKLNHIEGGVASLKTYKVIVSAAGLPGERDLQIVSNDLETVPSINVDFFANNAVYLIWNPDENGNGTVVPLGSVTYATYGSPDITIGFDCRFAFGSMILVYRENGQWKIEELTQ